MTPPAIKDVLAEVNRLRADRGMEPLSEMPKGHTSPFSCPLARALDVHAVVPTQGESWKPYYLIARNSDDETPLPRVLADFGQAFDADAYPELIAENA